MSSTTATARHRAVARPAPASSLGASRPAQDPAAAAVGRSIPRRMLGWLANGLLLLCLAVFLLVAVGPHLFGYRTATMLTGSMEPGIMPGDVVITTPEPASDVKVGDVISYHIPVEDRRVETHRVVEVLHQKNGTIAVRTQGDNNENADPWTASIEGDTVWEVQTVVPKLGSVIRFLRSDAIQHGIFWVALGGLLLLGLSLIWGKGSNDEGDERDGGRSS
jgi:signal peptidase